MSNQNNSVKHAGITVVLGSDEYVVPPLSFGQLRRMEAEINLLTAPVKEASEYKAKFDAVVKVTHAALSRNYPALSEDDVADMLDINTVKPVIHALLTAAGYDQAASGAEVASSDPLTGTGSTPV